MKIHPVGAELFHEDRLSEGRTDITELIVACRKYAKAPKKGRYYCVSTAALVNRSRHNATLYVRCLFYLVVNFRIDLQKRKCCMCTQ